VRVGHLRMLRWLYVCVKPFAAPIRVATLLSSTPPITNAASANTPCTPRMISQSHTVSNLFRWLYV